MPHIEQGDVLRVSGITLPVVVVSNNFFCRSGCAVVCPLLSKASEGPLHIYAETENLKGYVLCEQLKFLDLSGRRFTKLGSVPYFDMMDISDAVMGIFDYQTV